MWIHSIDNRLVHVTGHSQSVRDVVFSPDASVFATGSIDGNMRVWNTKTGKPMTAELPHSTDKPVAIRHVFFSPDGETICSIGANNLLAVWFWKRKND